MSTAEGNAWWIFSARVVFPDPVPPAIPTKRGAFAKTDSDMQQKIIKDRIIFPPKNGCRRRYVFLMLDVKIYRIVEVGIRPPCHLKRRMA